MSEVIEPQPNTGKNAPQSSGLPRHIPALDGLRGWAILLVLVCHFFAPGLEGEGGWGRWAGVLLGMTRHGVDLFFVLSGFLITGILCDTKDRPHYFRNFYGRRTVRIFPLYYLALVICFGVLPRFLSLDTPGLKAMWQDQWALWLYCSNWVMTWKQTWAFNADWLNLAHFWSLAVEEQFYLVWPLVVLALNRQRLMVLCGVLIVAALGLRMAMAAAGTQPLVMFVFTPCRIDALAIGSFLAVAVRGSWRIADLVKPARAVVLGSLIALPLVLLFSGGSQVIIAGLKYTFLGGLFGGLLVLTLAAPARSLLSRVMDNRPMRLLGKYSYGIYVFHHLLIPAFLAWFGPEILLGWFPSRVLANAIYFLLASAASMAVALVSWHLFEKHFLKLKRHFE